MYKQILGVVCVLTTLAGCAGKVENPIDYLTFRDEPLVKQVERGMSKERVLEIGGPASAEMQRSQQPGSCHNYILSKDGQQQPYYISFDSAELVDDKGFMTCEQMEAKQREQAKDDGY